MYCIGVFFSPMCSEFQTQALSDNELLAVEAIERAANVASPFLVSVYSVNVFVGHVWVRGWVNCTLCGGVNPVIGCCKPQTQCSLQVGVHVHARMYYTYKIIRMVG